MTKRHFEYLAAMLADIGQNGEPVDVAIVDFCKHFGANFDEGRFRSRVDQLASEHPSKIWRYVNR